MLEEISITSMSGIIIGVLSFLIIGIFHPIVIKAEYHYGVKIWPLFLIGGIICAIFSVFAKHIILSGCLGVAAFSFFWSIIELFHQKKRVAKGWFPKNNAQIL
jgi:branched-subunit amino acid transport protein